MSPVLHERVIPARKAGNVLASRLLDLVDGHVDDWSWEQASIALLTCERACLELASANRSSSFWFSNPDAREAWAIVMPWRREHDVTWLETARIIHHEVSSWLNYALRGERHPDDETGEKKADEA